MAGNLSPHLPWDLANPKWAASLNPVMANPMVFGTQLVDVKLINGTNYVNHLLGQKLQGWMIVRRRQYKVSGTPTAYDIYDTQDSNQMPTLTLQLTCNEGTLANPVVVDLWVY